MPVKDFLRFLQLYAQEKQLDELRSELLEFGEEHLIQGKVVQEGDETFYFDRRVGKPVSLYIASSMIHELTPFIKALSAARRIDWLYCDEVENSLHPLLQRDGAVVDPHGERRNTCDCKFTQRHHGKPFKQFVYADIFESEKRQF